MANEEAVTPVSSWLGEEPIETESTFAIYGVGEIPFGSIGEAEDWELVLPSTSDRVCSEYENHAFPMYEVVFKDMGFQLPFLDFQQEVLCWTKLSPSQIHPNSYAFMRAFELVCDYLRILASNNVFFTIFTVQRGAYWVSFRQTHKMFEIFVGKVRSFKECFFLVRPKNEATLDTLLEAVKDGVQERHPLFNLFGLKTTLAMSQKISTEPLPVSQRKRQMCANNFRRLFSLFPRGSKLTNGETHC